MNLTQKIERLEKENARLKRIEKQAKKLAQLILADGEKKQQNDEKNEPKQNAEAIEKNADYNRNIERAFALASGEKN